MDIFHHTTLHTHSDVKKEKEKKRKQCYNAHGMNVNPGEVELFFDLHVCIS